MSSRRAERAPADAPRVLVVDDEPDIRELLELTLVRMGLGVASVGTIAEAKERLKSERFDREHLSQVMWNLLRNAVRYAPGKPASVRIVLREFAGRVEISVVDDGPGVPAAIQGQLFVPFFTTDSKGTGLGLYLARELCAANRAALEYVDDMQGAHFRVLCREAPSA